jgi:hypothetical protein
MATKLGPHPGPQSPPSQAPAAAGPLASQPAKRVSVSAKLPQVPTVPVGQDTRGRDTETARTTVGPEILELRRPQAVRLLGVSERTFSRLEQEGVVAPIRPRNGRLGSTYDGYVLVVAYLAYLERKTLGGDKINESQERARRDRSTAELNELRLARERGLVVAREQVHHEARTFVTAVRARILALPRQLAQLGIIQPENQGRARAVCVEALSEMSAWSAAGHGPTNKTGQKKTKPQEKRRSA